MFVIHVNEGNLVAIIYMRNFYMKELLADNQREACRAAPGRLGADEEQQGEVLLLPPEDAGQPMGRAGGLEGARGEREVGGGGGRRGQASVSAGMCALTMQDLRAYVVGQGCKIEFNARLANSCASYW